MIMNDFNAIMYVWNYRKNKLVNGHASETNSSFIDKVTYRNFEPSIIIKFYLQTNHNKQINKMVE